MQAFREMSNVSTTHERCILLRHYSSSWKAHYSNFNMKLNSSADENMFVNIDTPGN